MVSSNDMKPTEFPSTKKVAKAIGVSESVMENGRDFMRKIGD